MNVRNHKLQSALHLAVRQAHVRLVLLLVDAGCSVNAEDEEGDTALHVALRHHQLLPLAADGAGGDPGPLQLLSRVRKRGPGCRLRQGDGPEPGPLGGAAVWGTAHRRGHPHAAWPASLRVCVLPSPGRGWGWAQNSAPPPERSPRALFLPASAPEASDTGLGAGAHASARRGSLRRAFRGQGPHRTCLPPSCRPQASRAAGS